MQKLTDGALVLEGGGMRGAFTTGVLDFFLDKEWMFNKIYGVSAGACHACSYISRQRERAFRIVADYINDPRYMGYSNLFKGQDFFPEEFVFHTIPDELDLFDYKTFREYEGEFYSVVTNCSTGKAEYLRVKDLKADIDTVRASASLPILSKMIRLNGGLYLDGGMADSIPVKKALTDGAKKCVVVLTQAEGFVKEPDKTYRLALLLHPLHRPLGLAMKHRHEVYNETLAYIDKLEKEGKIFVLRPLAEKLNVSRLERDRGKLEKLYDHGYETAAANYAKLAEYLGKDDAK